MHKTILTIISLFFILHLSAQEVEYKTVGKLDKELSETSGLIYYKGNLWTINDSGNKPYLYRFDKDGRITQTVDIKNSTNIDWEDISQDDKNIYISDTGNNAGKRREFTIYSIEKSKLPNDTSSFGEVEADRFVFTFDDQGEDLKPYAHDFDCEALICIEGQLGIFTKKWASGDTNFYILDKDSKKAKLINTYSSFGLITGANYDESTKTVYLIGYQMLNLQFFPFVAYINDFTLAHKGKLTRYQMPKLNGYQTEGICKCPLGLVISNETTDDAAASIGLIKLPEN